MENTTFAAAIFTALPYFLRLETLQYLNADMEAFKHEKDKLIKYPHKYDFIIGNFRRMFLKSLKTIRPWLWSVLK